MLRSLFRGRLFGGGARDVERALVLVTGVDRTHSKSMFQFLQSVRRFAPCTRTIIYDLGLDPADLTALSRQFPYEIRRFRFEDYPSFMDIRVNAGQYAWKPQIVWEVIEETGHPVCWMDAGNILTSSVRRIERALRRDGFYSPCSLGTVADWSHEDTLAYFGLDKAWGVGKRNLNGACVAFDVATASAALLARQWRDLALRQDVIAPIGSDRTNHRQDQTLLTILSYLTAQPNRVDKCLGFETHRDVD